MSNNKLFQINKLILEGRIYPAIRSCVNNRYKIILGLFAYYSFIFSSKIFFQVLTNSRGIVNDIVSIIFILFIIHNRINYKLNCKEQTVLETEIGYQCPVETISKHPNLLENLFTFISLVLIIGAWIMVRFIIPFDC
jgi:hypothetical protein